MSEPEERTVARARAATLGLATAPVLLALLAWWVPHGEGARGLVVPAGALGIVAPALAWRLHRRVRERARGAAAAREAFVRSIVLALAFTGAAATFGVVAWALSDDLSALIGLPVHVLLAGGLWPTREGLEHAEQEASG